MVSKLDLTYTAPKFNVVAPARLTRLAGLAGRRMAAWPA